MKIYIAGKITGGTDYKQKFQQAQEDLDGQGFTVLNPAILPQGLAPADYMRICLAMLDGADVVAFLPDYEQSRGAQLEWAWCQYVGKQTMCLEEDKNDQRQERRGDCAGAAGVASTEN